MAAIPQVMIGCHTFSLCQIPLPRIPHTSPHTPRQWGQPSGYCRSPTRRTSSAWQHTYVMLCCVKFFSMRFFPPLLLDLDDDPLVIYNKHDLPDVTFTTISPRFPEHTYFVIISPLLHLAYEYWLKFSFQQQWGHPWDRKQSNNYFYGDFW